MKEAIFARKSQGGTQIDNQHIVPNQNHITMIKILRLVLCVLRLKSDVYLTNKQMTMGKGEIEKKVEAEQWTYN